MENTRILELVKMSNLNKHQFELEVGLSNGSINKWSQGNWNPSADALIKLADYFGITLDELVGRTAPAERAVPALQRHTDAETTAMLELWANADDIQRAKTQAYLQGMINAEHADDQRRARQRNAE